MRSSLRRVATFLFASGACALVYQIAWFRELRLVFGGSTAASSAVLAVFMGGLGIGGIVLGKRVDRAANAFAMYANLELFVAAMAGLSPLLVRLAEALYVATGGSSTLGSFGAAVVRLLLTVIVLGPATFAMGGTMPAAARAVSTESDIGRRRLAVLYGVNTIGAVLGALAANFALIEIFGTRMTLWIACLLNALVGVAARAAARSQTADASPSEEEPAPEAAAPATTVKWFPPVAAAIVGFAFMLMELVWYRMLAPLLGGSSYTLGLILAVALAGIGIGGTIYAFGSRRTTLSLFALTCALEAFAIVVPYALGDRVALFALFISPLAKASFTGAILAWSLTSVAVILPAAIVAGYQFPLLISLYGRGKTDVGHDVGRAYLANTIGSIVGAIAGGFGLMPLLMAPRCWQLVVGLLVACAVLSLALERKLRGVPAAAVGVASALLALFARGPTPAWRHSGIGAGRASPNLTKERIAQFEASTTADVRWEADGLESSVALDQGRSYSFLVNGKSDGNISVDRATQVMSGLLAALLHDDPKRALVIGLGTGSTAGWLGSAAGIERVDVMELEPAILRVARDCAAANKNVLANPKVHVTLGDAREGLLTSREHYDVVFSEPSNPYRAGISSLYTEEYYRAVATHLTSDGVFAQWVQTYEVDAFVFATVVTTLRSVFPDVTVWETMEGDMILVGRAKPHPIDVERLRTRITEPAYAEALAAAWGTDSAEGVLAHFVADASFAQAVVDNHLGIVNYDDENALDFAFARNVGMTHELGADVQTLSLRLRTAVPPTIGAYDASARLEEQLLGEALDNAPIDAHVGNPTPEITDLTEALRRFKRRDFAGGLLQWAKMGRRPRSPYERATVGMALAMTGDPHFEELAPSLDAVTRDLLRGLWLHKKGADDEAADALIRGFIGAREDPWFLEPIIIEAIGDALEIGTRSVPAARKLSSVLSESFAVERARALRLHAYLTLAAHADDATACVAAFDRAGPLYLERDILEAKVACLVAAKDPRAAAAEQQLADFLALSPSFGLNVPTPPLPAHGQP